MHHRTHAFNEVVRTSESHCCRRRRHQHHRRLRRRRQQQQQRTHETNKLISVCLSALNTIAAHVDFFLLVEFRCSAAAACRYWMDRRQTKEIRFVQTYTWCRRLARSLRAWNDFSGDVGGVLLFACWWLLYAWHTRKRMRKSKRKEKQHPKRKQMQTTAMAIKRARA